MRKYFILSFFALISCQSQEKNVPVEEIRKASSVSSPVFPYHSGDYNWAAIENKDEGLKHQFFDKPPSDFTDEYHSYNTEYSNIDSLRKHLHVVDIDGNGRYDLIFEGQSGGEASEVAFILNTKNGFKTILKQFQHIKKIDIVNGKIARVYIQDPGCCAEYLVFNKVYDLQPNDQSEFKLSYISVHHTSTTFPTKYIRKPYNFELLKDHYKLRNKPMVDDTSDLMLGGDLHHGNDVAQLYKGTRGIVLASETDTGGRNWLLVEIYPKYKLAYSFFHESEFDKSPARKIGWIENGFVKQL